MAKTVYVGNLAPTVTQDLLRDVFGQIGPVEDVQFAHFDRTGQIADAARVTMQDDEAALEVQRRLNGVVLEGRRLAVSWDELPKGLRATEEVRQAAQELAQRLGEEPAAQRRIERVVRVAGIDFAQAITEEALSIEEAGGMMTLDGTRRRTAGGVFFYLVRGRISDDLRREIFTFHKKKKAGGDEPAASEEPPKAEGKRAPSGKPRDARSARQPDDRRPRARADANPSPRSRPSAASAPASPPKALTPDTRDHYARLQQQHAEAQSHLDEIRAKPANQQAGMFSAIKAVLDLQKQIDALVREYPQLKDS
jgi:RNA recognition motif-containing protein